MSVQRRRAIAIIVTLLLVAGGIGLHWSSERRTDAAVTAMEDVSARESAAANPAPAPAEPVVETPAVADAVVDEAPAAETSVADMPVAETAPETPVVETDVAETVAPEVAAAATDTPPVETEVAAIDPVEPLPTLPLADEAPVAEADPEAANDVAEDAASFDLVRVEPTGDAVIAGRTRAGATVELLRNGETHDIVVADASGAFAFIPPPLPPGTHEIALQVRDEDGSARRGRQSVTVVVAETQDAAPVVALAEPGAATRILSQPEAPESAAAADAAARDDTTAETEVADAQAEPAADEAPAVQVARADAAAPPPTRPGVRIASVEAESGGGLYVSGESAPGADVRLYLNETFVGGAEAGATGAVSFAIGRGVRPGLYRVRLDEIDDGDGRVTSRAEVTFEMPALPEVAQAADEAPEAALETDVAIETAAEVDVAAADPSADPSAEAPAVAADEAVILEGEGEARTATLTIPEINTALVVRGDSLWRISRRIYGNGIRYTVIFDANQDQIRNPNLIFPGQVFVLPTMEPGAEAADAR
ncbi:LysM peptidoglycan-binding domain-containing protein [Salinarimonas ramus]|uniref:LysM domain-containing protein n=1 Tax=Salinarimonas ramus TaxID=690164 RepID=A0A917Q8F0_9HYPH|nr:LysM peptidoglycan-binding domain-containing protein [Salinarimonas ramus]GGK35563.1 hypothetical protein GCM10011322_23040 [Salinarimonas ramus]